MTKQDIIQKVNHYLRPHQTSDMTIEIVEKSVKEDDGWWYVPIRSTSPEPITYTYFGVLTDIEGELKENDHLDVLLVPSA